MHGLHMQVLHVSWVNDMQYCIRTTAGLSACDCVTASATCCLIKFVELVAIVTLSRASFRRQRLALDFAAA